METKPPTLKLEITKENYDTAVTASSGSCLIADAIKRQYPKLSNIKVDVATVRFSDKKRGERYIYLTPARVAEALLAFDQGWKEENLPQKFQIRTALKVVPLARSASDVKTKAEHRARRLVELEAKEQEGALSTEDKRALTQIRNRKEAPERPTVYGVNKTETIQGDHVVVGGRPTPLHKTNPNLLHGRDRHFGARAAQPSEVMKRALKEAVDTAVKADRAKRRK